MTINEAMEKLRSAAGKGSVSMRVCIWDHRSGRGNDITYQAVICGENLPGRCVLFEANNIEEVVRGVLQQVDPPMVSDFTLDAVESEIADAKAGGK